MQESPRIAVAIPTYNEENYIQEVLESIVENSYPKERMKIYIADGISTDNTLLIAKRYLEKKSVNYQIIHNTKKLPAHGLNTIIMASNEDIFVRCDAHSIYEKGYISALVSFLVEKKHHEKLLAVGGCLIIKPYDRQNIMSNVIAKIVKSKWAIGNIAYRQQCEGSFPVRVDTVPYAVFWLDDLRRLGGFDEGLPYAEDDELNFRVIQSGGEVWMNPDAKSIYYSRGNLYSLAKQYFRYGMGKAFVLYKHKRVATVRQIVPLFHTFLSIVTLAGFLFKDSIYLIYFIPYIIFLFMATVNIKGENRIEYVLIPITISIIHYSYGMGYMYGLIKGIRKLKRFSI